MSDYPVNIISVGQNVIYGYFCTFTIIKFLYLLHGVVRFVHLEIAEGMPIHLKVYLFLTIEIQVRRTIRKLKKMFEDRFMFICM